MPSWNIHIAYVERALGTFGADSLGIRDPNSFLFGNLVPDIYVGYLVRPITRKIAYRETHFADPAFVPYPRYWEFWERYARPSADGEGHVSDVTLGAWTHLMADNVFNARTNERIAELGIAPGERTRERKQSDFDLYGRTLDISHAPEPTAHLLAEAAAFPQYEIAAPDARGACAAAARTVTQNREGCVTGAPEYSMLDAAFFSETFDFVYHLVVRNLRAYSERGARGWGDYGCDGYTARSPERDGSGGRKGTVDA